MERRCSAAVAPQHEKEGDDNYADVAFFFATSCNTKNKKK
jgi:hypothetical protein